MFFCAFSITENIFTFVDDEDVNKAMEFSPVKMPGSEPYHKNQKLMWNQKVANFHQLYI